MDLFVFLISGYYLFSIFLVYSIFTNKDNTTQQRITWSLILILLPFIGFILYVLIFKKQYGSPNRLITIIE